MRRLGTDFELLDFDCQHMVAAANAHRSRRADPQTSGGELTVAPVTDEQVERVRALVAAIPPGSVVHLWRHRLCRRAFQPAHRRLDHAHRLLRPALASGDHRIRAPRATFDHPAAGIAASRRGPRRRRPDRATRGPLRISTEARLNLKHQPHQGRGARQTRERVGGRSRVQRMNRKRNINARNNICGHSGSAFHRSISPSSASPQDSASTTTTPAAQEAGRQ